MRNMLSLGYFVFVASEIACFIRYILIFKNELLWMMSFGTCLAVSVFYFILIDKIKNEVKNRYPK